MSAVPMVLGGRGGGWVGVVRVEGERFGRVRDPGGEFREDSGGRGKRVMCYRAPLLLHKDTTQ